MADHVDEVLQLRLRDVETRVDNEANEVKEHFAELRLFMAEGLQTLKVELRQEMGELKIELRQEIAELRVELREEIAGLRVELRSELRAVRAELRSEIARLDRRLDAHELRFTALEQKIDAHHAATHVVLQEILHRLPSAA